LGQPDGDPRPVAEPVTVTKYLDRSNVLPLMVNLVDLDPGVFAGDSDAPPLGGRNSARWGARRFAGQRCLDDADLLEPELCSRVPPRGRIGEIVGGTDEVEDRAGGTGPIDPPSLGDLAAEILPPGEVLGDPRDRPRRLGGIGPASIVETIWWMVTPCSRSSR
jgi:hypothetical protein